MGSQIRNLGAVLALYLLLAPAASAQDGTQNNSVVLPPIDVSSSRLGAGIVGASTSVITSGDIESSPAQNLPDILSQQAGVQVQHLFSGANGSRDTVDLRGFGAFAPSNVLILINGRRYQDFDLQGFDFSAIPLNSIERIEITRGNSGTVVYGDGAIGGVINIVTKTRTSSKFTNRAEAFYGSYNYKEGRVSAGGASGPWSVALFGNAIASSGYRDNSALRQQNINANLQYAGAGWGGYVNLAADTQRQGLAGGLFNLPGNYPFTLNTPQASNTPLDWAKKQGINLTAGINATVSPGVELIVDGGVRRKYQQATFFSYLDPNTFLYNLSAAAPMNYVNTVMTTTSLTPRLDASYSLFGKAGRILTGIDFYNTLYTSDRPAAEGLIPVHSYNIGQTTTAFYAMNTLSIRPDTELSLGGRVQRNSIKAQDTYNAAQDPNAGFYPNDPQAPPLDKREWQYAAHVGLEYHLNPALTLFGRAARAFRLGNADERVGAGGPFIFLTPNFNLRTQTSHDIEGGFRFNSAQFDLESSIYLMKLNDEIHFLPALGVDTNLDPTQRMGWETTGLYRISNAVRLRGNVAYTRATFRDGLYAGNDIPLVSRWSGYAGLSWDIVEKLLVLDLTTRVQGARRMDNDQINRQPLIPAMATVDAKLGGQYDRFFWSVAVLNLLDRRYYDYAIASGGIAGGPFFPSGLPPTIGFFTAYPLPGRTYTLKVGGTF